MRRFDLIEQAREFDRLDKPSEAAETYEEAIRTADAPLDMYVDLVALYFVCGDPGYYGEHNLSNEFCTNAYYRMFELETEAQKKFGYNSEIKFWIRFMGDVLYGETVSGEEYEEIALSGDSPVPYMVAFFYYKNNEDYRKRAVEAFLMSEDESYS